MVVKEAQAEEAEHLPVIIFIIKTKSMTHPQ